MRRSSCCFMNTREKIVWPIKCMRSRSTFVYSHITYSTVMFSPAPLQSRITSSIAAMKVSFVPTTLKVSKSSKAEAIPCACESPEEDAAVLIARSIPRVTLSRSVPDMNACANWVQAFLAGESAGAIRTSGNTPGPVLKHPVAIKRSGAAITNKDVTLLDI